MPYPILDEAAHALHMKNWFKETRHKYITNHPDVNLQYFTFDESGFCIIPCLAEVLIDYYEQLTLKDKVTFLLLSTSQSNIRNHREIVWEYKTHDRLNNDCITMLGHLKTLRTLEGKEINVTHMLECLYNALISNGISEEFDRIREQYRIWDSHDWPESLK